MPFFARGGFGEGVHEGLIAQKGVDEPGQPFIFDAAHDLDEFGEGFVERFRDVGQVAEVEFAFAQGEHLIDPNLEAALVTGNRALHIDDVAQLEQLGHRRGVVPQNAPDLAGLVFKHHAEELPAVALVAQVLADGEEVIVYAIALLEGFDELPFHEISFACFRPGRRRRSSESPGAASMA